jgi:hypothetical protein
LAFSPLLWSFPPTATFTSFPAPGCLACATTPAFSGRLVYLQFREGFPLPTSLALRAPHPLCYMFFCYYCLLFSFFSFFPACVLVYPGGYADLAQGCLWEYRMTLSSPCGLLFPTIWALLSGGGAGALLVSLFNVEWECYAWAGGVEESKFCLF